MARRKSIDDEIRKNSGSVGYSDKALKALYGGTYDKLTKRNPASMDSQEQVNIANPLPVLNGISIPNDIEWQSRSGRARQYQQNLENEAKKYQYNETAAKKNTLDNKDREYMKAVMAQGNEESQRKMLESKYNKEGWGQKYGKSVDEIYRDYVADQGNETMRMGESHPILSTIYSTLADLGNPVTTLPSLIANAVAPNSDFAKKAETHRAHYSENKKRLRAGVKENFGDKGDSVYDTATNLADRMLNTVVGSKIGGPVGSGVMTGLSDASQQMDQLNLRPDISNRQKALSALAHGTVEGVGTGITKGLLDNLPVVNGIGGRLLNVGKGAGNAAAENAISEAVEMGLDTLINGENSERELNKAIYMSQGMSEPEAEEQVQNDQWGRVKLAAGTGALFGGATKGLGEITDAIRKIPMLKSMTPEAVDTSDIDNVIDNATKQAETAKANIQNLADQIPEAENTTRVELPENTKPVKPEIKPLEGAELEEAQKELASFDNRINALKNNIELYSRQKNNKGNTTKAAKEKIKEAEAEIKKLEDNKVDVTRRINGETKPVIEQLKNAAAVKDFKKSLNKIAKMSPENKGLAQDAKAALDEYIETGDMDAFSRLSGDLSKINEYSRNIPEYMEDWGNNENGIWEAFYRGSLADALNEAKEIHARTAAESAPDRIGMNEVEPDNVPPTNPPIPSDGGNVPPETDISRRYETLKKSDLFQKSEANMKMLETAKEQGVFNKDVEGRAKAQADALQEFTEDPTKAINNNLNSQWSSGKDLDTSMLVLNDALDTGSQAYANLVMLKQAQQVKQAGRILRATLDYAKRNYAGTKEGTLQEAAKFLNDKAEAVLSNRKTAEQFNAIAERIMKGDLSDLSTRFNMDDVNIQNIKNALEAGAGKTDIAHMIAMYQSVGKTGISAEALQKITDIYNQIQEQNLEPNSRARANLEADAFKVLAQDIGGKRTFKEQWDAWRYLAMLGNPKTHLRNLLGNATHYMVTEAKDNIGAVMEAAIDKANKAVGGEGIDRTKSVLTSKDRGLVQAGELDADNVAYAALNDSGNKYNVKNELDRARASFNNKALSKVDELNSNLLDLEDYSALKRKYSRSLARFLKANGADESIFKATDEASKALLEKGRAYAIDQAKQATFHEYSKTAAMLSRFSNDMANSDKLHHKAAAYMLEGVLPFKKTPINILKQGGKYSPISLATGLKKAFDAVQTGNSTAAEAIEDLSAGLTGTGIMGLGLFLANQGFLTGSANPDYTVDQAETEQGAQNYALKIGDNSYTLDWLAPMSLPLFVGAELNKLMNEDDDEGLTLNKAISALSTIAEPITEMSMLQGINDVLEKLSYDPAGALAGLATQTGLGYITQGVPTIAGQVARAADDTRRSTYSENTGAEKQLDKALMKVQNKIPFLSRSSQPYVTASGQEQKNEGLASTYLGDNFGTRLMDQMLSPGYFKQGTISETDKELNRLYEATGESPYMNVLSGKVDGQQLGKESFTSYQKLYGSNNDYLYDEIIKSDQYKNLDDAEKVKALKSIRDTSKMIADHEIGGKELEKSQQKVYDIYKSKGKEGLLQYFKDRATADSLGMRYDSYIKKEAETPGGATQWMADKDNALNMGFTKKDGTVNMDSYEKAKEIVGDDPNALAAYSDYAKQGFTKNADRLYYLENNPTFTNEQKGQMLTSFKEDGSINGQTAQSVYDMSGFEGMYYYYLLKNNAESNGKSGINKKERAAYFASDAPELDQLWNYNQDLYYYLMNNIK